MGGIDNLRCRNCGFVTCLRCLGTFNPADIEFHQAENRCSNREVDGLIPVKDTSGGPASEVQNEGSWRRRRARLSEGLKEGFWNFRYNM